MRGPDPGYRYGGAPNGAHPQTPLAHDQAITPPNLPAVDRRLPSRLHRTTFPESARCVSRPPRPDFYDR